MVSCVILSQDCGAVWLKLWQKCQDQSAFLVSVIVELYRKRVVMCRYKDDHQDSDRIIQC